MRQLLASAVACALAITAAAVETPAAAPTPEDLVASLGSARFAERESAARALEEMGAKALPALEAAIRSGNPEIRSRAVRIAARLHRLSDSTSLLGAKKIKLAYRNIPLGTALNDLKARTGINLTLDPNLVADPLRPVTVETGEVAAWEALDAFCSQAGLREIFVGELPVPKEQTQRRGYYTPPPPPPIAEAVPVTLADGKHARLPGSRSAAVRVLALPRSFPGHRAHLGTGDFVLCFDITPIPGLHWQEPNGIRVTKLIDDAGRFGTEGTLEKPPVSPNDPFGGGAAFLGGPGGRVVVMRWDREGNPILPAEHPNPRVVNVPLKIATPTARSLKLLEGVVLGEILEPDRVLATFTNPAAGRNAAATAIDGTTLIIQDLSKTADGGASFRIEIRGESPQQRANGFGPWAVPMWPDQATRGVPAGPKVRGFDDRGLPVAITSTQVTSINDDGTTRTTILDVVFRKAVPAKLQVTGPAMVPVEVPFRMENVPLP